MTERKPSDDLKEGLGMLFRAARNATKDLSAEKAEKAIYDSGSELGRVLSNVGKAMGDELSKAFGEKADEGAVPEAPPPASEKGAPVESGPGTTEQEDAATKTEPKTPKE